MSVVSGFCCRVNEIFLLKSYTALISTYLRTFRDNPFLQSWRDKQCKLKEGNLLLCDVIVNDVFCVLWHHFLITRSKSCNHNILHLLLMSSIMRFCIQTDNINNNKECMKYCLSVKNYTSLLRSDIWRLFMLDNKNKTNVHI